MTLSRRDVLLTTSAALAAGAGGLAAEPAARRPGGIGLSDGARILFQGDSITDADRSRETEGRANDFAMLGTGYPRLLAYHLLASYPEKRLKFLNRGISGNKVPDLAGRWQRDCVALEPDVVSVLVGVNDLWHKRNGNYKGTVEDYGAGLQALLEGTLERVPGVQLVVCEMFALRTGAVDDSWYPEFDERRAACRKAADTVGAVFVPFQTMFDSAVSAGAAPAFWAGDGVHPSAAGHALMAMQWLRATALG